MRATSHMDFLNPLVPYSHCGLIVSSFRTKKHKIWNGGHSGSSFTFESGANVNMLLMYYSGACIKLLAGWRYYQISLSKHDWSASSGPV